MFNLRKILGMASSFPEVDMVVNTIDREGKFIRIYCFSDGRYEFKEIDHEEGDPSFFNLVREKKYLL